ncbi:MAG: AAA family ATPase, partial [Clostridia bacterium]|nr:AAA family ATPase [Clostridia bacterium]
MKLLSCYIENYGQIKKQDFTFDKNLTSYCERNGFGKSTLASFIKAMFYGLEPYRSNSAGFCERLHFFPFDGGRFGGNLTFEAGGKTYKIERFFGEKSDTQDECAVYLNGKKTDAFGSEIGKAVFGIDAKSFERTVFIGSDEIEIKSTASISAKLNNFIDGDEGLENALKILEESRKEYKKSRSGNDLISQKKSKIERLNRDITNAQNIRDALAGKYEKHTALREKIASLEKQAEEARAVDLVLKDWER